jgi:hypothetical protein
MDEEKDNKTLAVIDNEMIIITHMIDLKDVKHGRAKMFYNGELLGISSQPLFFAARWLLKHDKADANDTIQTYRGSTMSMRAKVGVAARMTVEEDDRGLRFREYKLPPSCDRPLPMREAA